MIESGLSIIRNINEWEKEQNLRRKTTQGMSSIVNTPENDYGARKNQERDYEINATFDWMKG